MVKTFALTFFMIIKRAKSRGMQITTIFKFLNLIAVFTQSKAYLFDGIDRECTFQIQTLNSLSMSAHGFLRMNADSWVNLTILILLALNIRIDYRLNKCIKKIGSFRIFKQNMSKSVGWNLSRSEEMCMVMMMNCYCGMVNRQKT